MFHVVINALIYKWFLLIIAKISEDKISEKELRYLLEKAQMGGEVINFQDFFETPRKTKKMIIVMEGKED